MRRIVGLLTAFVAMAYGCSDQITPVDQPLVGPAAGAAPRDQERAAAMPYRRQSP